MFKYGDCSSCTASACLSVPSNTESPVVFTKSASSTLSFSVRRPDVLDRRYIPSPISTTSNPAATGRIIFQWIFDLPSTAAADAGADEAEV